MVPSDPDFKRCIFRCTLVFHESSRTVYNDAKTALHQLTRLERVNAKAATRPCTLVDGGRLGMLVKPGGAKLWRWNYDFAGKTETMALGGWPKVSEKEARAAHAAGRQLPRLGVDPMQRR
ncbi:Arm DNA-binding domain-containing protein [Caballeronia udeis]